MKPQHRAVLSAIAGAALFVFAAACGSSRTNSSSGTGGGGGGGGGGGTTFPLLASVAPFAQWKITIQSATLPAGGPATVTFQVTANGQPVTDLIAQIQNAPPSGSTTPKDPTKAWATNPRFTLAHMAPASAPNQSGQYASYYTRTETDNTPNTVTQANFDQPTAASLPTQLVSQGNGVYVYTFNPLPAGTTVDGTQVHTAGLWITQHPPPSASGITPLSTGYPSSSTINFIPNGGTATARDIVTTEACSVCHTPALSAHDQRLGVQLCITCHSPQTTDAGSGNTVDFRVMIHKIHSGASLPSVQNGGTYQIIGFNNTVSDFSDVVFPPGVSNCTVCHHGGAQSANWQTSVQVEACGSCHDNVKWQGISPDFSASLPACGAGVTMPCQHPAGATATNCLTCHVVGSALGADKVHPAPIQAESARYKFEITNVTIGADRKPVVQYHVLRDGQPVDVTTDAAFTQTSGSAPSRLAVDIGWPSAEYTNSGSGQQFGQPVSIDALKNATPVAGQAGMFQVTSTVAIPADVTGTFTAALEGHPATYAGESLPAGQRVPVTSAVQYVAVAGGTATPRRQVVSIDKCQACHRQLSLHGSNRTGTTEICVICHNPVATDGGQAPAGAPQETIDFKHFIHLVHANDIHVGDPTVIFGFGGSQNPFPAGFPGTTYDCAMCHVDTTYQVPTDPNIPAATVVGTTTTPAVQSICTGCHNATQFDASASSLKKCNDPAFAASTDTTCQHSGGAGITSGCAGCHGAGGPFDVAKVHAVGISIGKPAQ